MVNFTRGRRSTRPEPLSAPRRRGAAPAAWMPDLRGVIRVSEVQSGSPVEVNSSWGPINRSSVSQKGVSPDSRSPRGPLDAEACCQRGTSGHGRCKRAGLRCYRPVTFSPERALEALSGTGEGRLWNWMNCSQPVGAFDKALCSDPQKSLLPLNGLSGPSAWEGVAL